MQKPTTTLMAYGRAEQQYTETVTAWEGTRQDLNSNTLQWRAPLKNEDSHLESHPMEKGEKEPGA